MTLLDQIGNADLLISRNVLVKFSKYLIKDVPNKNIEVISV